MRFPLSTSLCGVLGLSSPIPANRRQQSRLQYLVWRGKRLLTLRAGVVFFSAPSRGPVHVQTVGLTGFAKPSEFPDDGLEAWSGL